jgi:hypothetical protein
MKPITMKMIAIFLTISGLFAGSCFAGESATPQEIYDMVLKGATVLKQLGKEGLAAFNDPKGEFAWKDTYVQVYNCEAQQIVGHINPALLAWTPEKFAGIKDPKGNNITKLICEGSKNSNGSWVEYWWPKPGETEPSRKITFVIQVPGMPYQVSAGIYDDKISLEELNKMNK